LLAQLAQQIGAANDRAEVERLLQLVEHMPEADDALGDSLVRSLMMGRPAAKPIELPPKCQLHWGRRLETACGVALDAKQTSDARKAAIQLVAFLPLDQSQETWRALLDRSDDEAVQTAAIKRLAKYRDPEVADLLLAAWPALSKPARQAAVETLLERRQWTEALFSAVERGQIARDEVDAGRVQLLYLSPEAAVRDRAVRVFGAPVTESRAEVVAAYRSALDTRGDVKRGRVVFRARCAACHRLEDNGRTLGADLAAVGDRGAASVLLNILDPNREVKPNFQVHTLLTSDGRVLTGLVSGETATSLAVHQADGSTTTILRRDIEEQQNTGRSFMPEGLEKQITVAEMADLLAYLLAKK
jgi:putative heme-binding domain-containing protein